MANELNITIIGRLTEDPALRYTPAGVAVANLTIAQNSRVFDKNSNEWKDKPTNFFRCSIWREAAEQVTESLQKGMAVIAYGEVTSRSYDTKEGEKRTVQEIELQNIGPDLKWATAKVAKAQKNNGGGNQQGGQWGGHQPAQPSGFGPSTAPQDPWANQSQPTFGNGLDTEPPF